MEALRSTWEGAIPVQISLHESEITSFPSPDPAHILAPRIGYLTLLAPFIKPHFRDALPPGADTLWFDYRGLPLKWYVPTGVLFDLLCSEPERPWKLTVHFREYPRNLLIAYEGEDSARWNFMNTLKEADYIINGNCKSVMSMSQPDETDIWQSIVNGDLEAHCRVLSKLQFGMFEDELLVRTRLRLPSPGTPSLTAASTRTKGRIPVRFYVRRVEGDLESASRVESWDEISFINRPLEISASGHCFTLGDAVRALIPESFCHKSSSAENRDDGKQEGLECGSQFETEQTETSSRQCDDSGECGGTRIKIVRVQGILPRLDIPFLWLVNNLKNPDQFLHVCVYLESPKTLV